MTNTNLWEHLACNHAWTRKRRTTRARARPMTAPWIKMAPEHHSSHWHTLCCCRGVSTPHLQVPEATQACQDLHGRLPLCRAVYHRGYQQPQGLELWHLGGGGQQPAQHGRGFHLQLMLRRCSNWLCNIGGKWTFNHMIERNGHHCTRVQVTNRTHSAALHSSGRCTWMLRLFAELPRTL